MLTRLELKGFKCLTEFNQELGGLTLLTGFNAVGKSSVIQSIALLKQTVSESEWSKSLTLNGSSVQLGTMFDVIDRNSGGEGFSLALSTGRGRCEWETKSVDRKRDLAAALLRVHVSSAGYERVWLSEELATERLQRLMPDGCRDHLPDFYQELQGLLASITHVGAERIGPREVYLANSPLGYPDVGTQGERTPWCLEQFADESINPSLERPGVAKTVRLTVKAWMAQFFPGFDIEIRRVDTANLMTIGIRTSTGGDFFRPTNVGFGLTHVLPIITACVAASPGRLLAIENPETHLHPAGQSEVGYFLAMAASAGVQLIVETHSDHVLNGIRRAIRDGQLPAERARVYFFNADVDDKGAARTVVTHVPIEDNGRVAGWPAGFFDQIELDIDDIFRP